MPFSNLIGTRPKTYKKPALIESAPNWCHSTEAGFLQYIRNRFLPLVKIKNQKIVARPPSRAVRHADIQTSVCCGHWLANMLQILRHTI